MRGGFAAAAATRALAGQFEAPYGPVGPPSMFTVPVLRYLKTYGLTEEDLAWPAVIQREWAALNPRASFHEPITVDDVLNSRMIAWPFRMLMCCLVTDGGGALVLDQRRARQGFTDQAGLRSGHGRERRDADGEPDGRLYLVSRLSRSPGRRRSRKRGIRTCRRNDHLMIYDAFAHLPLYGLEDHGFCKPGEAAAFIRERNTALPKDGKPIGKLPLNTNGGGLSYMHSGMYGMYAMQESIRQMRGIAPAQVPNAKISISHGVGGMFAASGTIVWSNEAP